MYLGASALPLARLLEAHSMSPELMYRSMTSSAGLLVAVGLAPVRRPPRAVDPGVRPAPVCAALDAGAPALDRPRERRRGAPERAAPRQRELGLRAAVGRRAGDARCGGGGGRGGRRGHAQGRDGRSGGALRRDRERHACVASFPLLVLLEVSNSIGSITDSPLSLSRVRRHRSCVPVAVHDVGEPRVGRHVDREPEHQRDPGSVVVAATAVRLLWTSLSLSRAHVRELDRTGRTP